MQIDPPSSWYEIPMCFSEEYNEELEMKKKKEEEAFDFFSLDYQGNY